MPLFSRFKKDNNPDFQHEFESLEAPLPEKSAKKLKEIFGKKVINSLWNVLGSI